MKAAALLTPFLVLGLLHVLQRLEVWTGSSGGARHPRKKEPRMTQQHDGQTEPHGEAPLLRDPPPPPGYVEPLAGSSAEDALPAPADDGAPDDVALRRAAPRTVRRHCTGLRADPTVPPSQRRVTGVTQAQAHDEPERVDEAARVAALIPMLRRIVGARVGAHPAAEDIVQETLVRVLAARGPDRAGDARALRHHDRAQRHRHHVATATTGTLRNQHRAPRPQRARATPRTRRRHRGAVRDQPRRSAG